MWATIMCPKCGERFEINLDEAGDKAVCCYCLENFEIPAHVRQQVDEEDGNELYAFSGAQDQVGLDSSFWLS